MFANMLKKKKKRKEEILINFIVIQFYYLQLTISSTSLATTMPKSKLKEFYSQFYTPYELVADRTLLYISHNT